MHDCRSQGGHFFVYKPQDHPFRCRRCTERFVSSFTDLRLKHPWKCLIERCEYVACDPCSDILAEELAMSRGDEPLVLQSLSVKDTKPEDGQRKRRGGGVVESAVLAVQRDIAPKDAPKKLLPRLGVAGKLGDVLGFGKIEVDDDDVESPYSVPIFTRTARQAAAQAVLKRTHIKLRPVTRRGAEMSDI